MVKAKRLSKRLLVFASLALPVIVLTVAATPPDWFRAAEITGVIVETESNVVEAIIDLGDLPSATPFSVSGDGTITVAESGGLKIEKFVVGCPHEEDGYGYEEYFTNRFYSLSVNLTVGDTTRNVIMVMDGSWDWWYWDYEYDEYPWGYRRYTDWLAITVPQGTHTATFTIYGTTALRTESIGFEMMCYFTFAPA